AVPDDVPVLLPAARFLADADELLRRDASTGVIWPNDRKVAELASHLDRLALVALVFPALKYGRAFTQARLIRDRYVFAAELVATGLVPRDEFLFLLRAGFEAFEVTKAADAAVFVETERRYSVFYAPTADGRTTALRARLTRVRASPTRETVEDMC